MQPPRARRARARRRRGGGGALRGAEAVARTLAARGVGTVFTLCGDHTNPILEACDDAAIRIVDARDERGAAWMAAGWALTTGRPGVVVVSGPAALLNAATALADSNAAGTPVVCIAGAVAAADEGAGHPGDAPMVEIAAPWCKAAVRIPHADRIARTLGWGLSDSLEARPGAITLEVPLDVQTMQTTASLEDAPSAPPVAPDPSRLAEAARILGGARRPAILAGSGCFWSGAGEALRALAERARIPVFTTRAARGLVSDDHELCFGFPNLLAPHAQLVFAEADVVLVVGTTLDVVLGGGSFSGTLVRVDADPGAFSLGRAADLEVVADARLVLEALAARASRLPTDAWLARLRMAADDRTREIATRARIASTPLHPARLVAEVAAKLPQDAIVCVDAGELALWALDAIPARAPSAFHASSFSRLAALGMGLPWAIGAKVAAPDRPVVALVGDGSFGFTALEMETSARHGAPVAVVIGNDGGWGIVRHLQQALHGRAIASDLPRSPYELLAEFAGGIGDLVQTPHQLGIALTNALVAKLPTIVNTLIDAGARHEAIPLIAAMFSPEG